jgi:aspartate racemase
MSDVVSQRRVAGIIGGMGPQATINFLTTMLRLTTSARTDKEHIPTLVYNDPRIPDRNLAFANQGPSPEPMLADIARALERAGADFLVMPCNTAHVYAAAIRAASSLPFIDMIEVTSNALASDHPSVRVAGLLATPACTASGLYARALAKRGMKLLTLSDSDEQKFINIVYLLKSGGFDSSAHRSLQRLAMGLVRRGAGAIVSACTELPLILRPADITCPLIDSTIALANWSVRYAMCEI